MGKTYHIGKITKDQQMKMVKSANRQIDIDDNRNVNLHRVHKTKKAYNRNENKRVFDWAE